MIVRLPNNMDHYKSTSINQAGEKTIIKLKLLIV